MEGNFTLARDNFETYLRLERRLSENTVLSYLNDVKQMSAYVSDVYGVELVTAVEVIHLRSWLSKLKEEKISNRSLRRKIAALNTFFRFLMAADVLKKNPAHKLLLPKISKPLPDFLEEKQTEKLILETDFSDDFGDATQQLIIELLYQTGMRRNELIQLKKQDIHYSQREVQILGKGGKTRIVPISKPLVLLLKNYDELKRKTFPFPTENFLSLKSGKKLYANYVYRVVKKYLSMLTTLEKRSPHVLRHTFASQLLNNGADLMAIKDLLGHTSLAATQVYTHLNIERLKEVYKNAHPKS